MEGSAKISIFRMKSLVGKFPVMTVSPSLVHHFGPPRLVNAQRDLEGNRATHVEMVPEFYRRGLPMNC